MKKIIRPSMMFSTVRKNCTMEYCTYSSQHSPGSRDITVITLICMNACMTYASSMYNG